MTPQVIDRLVRRPAAAPEEPPLTANRAIGLSVARAAQDILGLTISVEQIADEGCDLPALTEALEDDLLILSIARDGGTAGVIACNAELVAAALEALTTGRVAKTAQEPRPVTNTDAALIRPWCAQILQDLAETLDGWSAGCIVGPRFETVRAVEFDLDENDFRMLRIDLSDRSTDRKPRLMLALPDAEQTAAEPSDPVCEDWAERLSDVVMAAPIALDAVLTRMPMTMGQLTGLEVGDCVPLTATGLDKIALTATDGFIVARGRLGQLDGRIAVRVDLSDRRAPREMGDYPRPGATPLTVVERELSAGSDPDSLTREAS